MRTIGSSCRRGISSILGTIIFVSIIFTAFIPMLLVMKQADTLHEMRTFELERFDDEKESEDIHVYVFEKTTSPDILTLRVENWGDFSVNIERIWINETCYLLDNFNVQPANWLEEELTGFTAEPDTRYLIKVATNRGNVFFTESGSLYFDEFGNLDAGMFTIDFIISYPAAGWFDIEIKNDIGTILTDPPFSIHKSGLDSAYDFFDVPDAGTYHVKITKRGAEVIYNDDVTIYWPNGPPSAKVRA